VVTWTALNLPKMKFSGGDFLSKYGRANELSGFVGTRNFFTV
jgi:hypothetical protein